MTGLRDLEKVCHFCNKKGHVKAHCFALQKRNKQTSVKSAALATSAVSILPDMPCSEGPEEVLEEYWPFIFYGYVSLGSSREKVPFTVLRDTGALDSFILASAPRLFRGDRHWGFCAWSGDGIGCFVCSDSQTSSLFRFGAGGSVHWSAPVKGVHLILGNGLAGGRVWPGVPPLLVVNAVCSNTECERELPEVFPACVVTRAGARTGCGELDNVTVLVETCVNL